MKSNLKNIGVNVEVTNICNELDDIAKNYILTKISANVGS